MKWLCKQNTDSIRQNRIRFTGNLFRLPEETPARKSLDIALTAAKQPRGRPPINWIKLTNNDLQYPGVERLGSQKLQITASDKQKCKKIVANAVFNGRSPSLS